MCTLHVQNKKIHWLMKSGVHGSSHAKVGEQHLVTMHGQQMECGELLFKNLLL